MKSELPDRSTPSFSTASTTLSGVVQVITGKITGLLGNSIKAFDEEQLIVFLLDVFGIFYYEVTFETKLVFSERMLKTMFHTIEGAF